MADLTLVAKTPEFPTSFWIVGTDDEPDEKRLAIEGLLPTILGAGRRRDELPNLIEGLLDGKLDAGQAVLLDRVVENQDAAQQARRAGIAWQGSEHLLTTEQVTAKNFLGHAKLSTSGGCLKKVFLLKVPANNCVFDG